MRTNYENFVNSFLEYLELELNYSKETKSTYNEVLKEYGKFVITKNLNFLRLTIDDANHYKAHLISSGYSNKTSSLHLSAVRSFYNFLIEINAINNNPFASIKNPKIEKKLPNFLNNSEISVLYDDKNNLNDLEIRNKLIIDFLYATGIRVSEATSIKVSDLDFSNYSFKVFGKGSKERIIYFKACDLDLLDLYLKKTRFNILNGVASEYLFISKSGNPLTSRSIENIVKSFFRDKNIKNKVTPHTMRHTYATDLLNNGADIRSVGELLGHESLNTTQIYTHVTSERLKSVYLKTHPREKNNK